ncbi:MAG: hypothetical protein AAF414_24965 [Pseudomonadota bacterium]
MAEAGPAPVDAQSQPADGGDISVDGVTAASATTDGGVLIAGFTFRPDGQGHLMSHA